MDNDDHRVITETNMVKPPEVKYKEVEVNGLRKRTFATGLVIEELKKVNNEYSRIVTPGNKVCSHLFGVQYYFSCFLIFLLFL